MKHIAFFMAALLLTLSFVSCGGNAGNDVESTPDTTEAITTEAETTEAVTEDADLPEAGTFGADLLGYFRTLYAENSTASAEELAGMLSMNENIPWMLGGMPIEAGVTYLNGFKDQDVDDASTLITGYKEGAMVMPMVGVIPFVAYIFTMDEGADVDAFIDSLKERMDMRWNICTEADQLVVDVQGDKVFFSMCPASTAEEQ